MRATYAASQDKLVENWLAVSQNRGLYEVFAALAASPDFATLANEDRVALQYAIRDFVLSGVALDREDRERFRKISMELSSISTEFRSAVLDATEAWSEHVTDRAMLAGLSEPDREMFADAARSRGLDGWLITLQEPSIAAIITFAEDRDLRARVYEAYGTRASDRGPHAGQFDNSSCIARILELRREIAELLGFADTVAWSLATKMAPDADEVLAFLRDLARRGRAAAEQDFAELRAFAKESLGLPDLQAWDIGFASNRLREARYTVNKQEVREYFPIEQVTAGWQHLLGELFGIQLTRRDDVSLYHADAGYYEVADDSGEVIAGLYVDLHSRDGKRAGAWMDSARPRLDKGDSVTIPVAYLVCNFAPAGGETPPLLSHSDIVTLLHETGHALHHLFTRVNRPSIAGIRGFEWDAVELPSQLMEDFAWDRSVLTSMSRHYRTGERLSDALFDRMLTARQFQAGMSLIRQVEFSLFDLVLHQGGLGDDPMKVLEAVREEIAVVSPPEWHRFPHSFNHIFAGGYGAGYYSYLWAEVLAADGFLRFAEAGSLDRATGDAFRTELLSQGATRSAAVSFRAFRGRNAAPEAILRRRGLM